MLKKLLLFVLVLFFSSANAQQISLPIEVFGLPQEISENNSVLKSLGLKHGFVDVKFTINKTMHDSIATSGKGLYLQVNNLSYNRKAAIRINSSSADDWIVLDQGGTAYDETNSSTNVEIYDQEAKRGGMAHGGYNTIRLKVKDVKQSNFVDGENTITFRFEKSDGISNGYRVIDLDLLDSYGHRILEAEEHYLEAGGSSVAGSYFTKADPLTWTDPYTEKGLSLSPVQLVDSISKGKDIWYCGSGGVYDGSATDNCSTTGANLWNNYLPAGTESFWYGYNLGASKSINAKCTNCHTQDGRDLEIFAYSNQSIIERSKFHRLTEAEGELVATYIRFLSSTDGEKGNIHRYGRPWNPPYQPGEGLKGKSIDEWSAGAGLDAVLKTDTEMLKGLFSKENSSTIDQEEVYKHFDSDGNIDRTELPLAIQFPDWKHWLPMVHPMDAYTKDDYWNVSSKEYNPKQAYLDLRKFLEDNKSTYSRINITEAEAEALMSRITSFWTHYRLFFVQGVEQKEWNHWRTRNGTASRKLDGVPREFAATSLARLMAVQFFEVMNEFGLQDKAQYWYGKDPLDHVNKRQWIGREYQIFEIPAHFQACVPKEEAPDNPPYHELEIAENGSHCQNFYGQPKQTGQYESTNWYHAQAIVNGGEGMMEHNNPVDYNYQGEFILRASKSSGLHEPLRYFHTLNTMYQTKTWSGDVNPNNGKGFRMRVMGPWYFLGKEADGGGSQLHSFKSLEFIKTMNGVDKLKGLLPKILNAQFKQFLTEIRKDQNKLYIEDNEDFANGNQNWWRFGNDVLEFPSRPNSQKGADPSQNLDPVSKTHIYDVTKGFKRDPNQEVNVFNSLANAPLYADHMYWVLKEAQTIEGVDCNILHRLKDWSQEAWPNVSKFVVKNDETIQSITDIGWDSVLSGCTRTPIFTDGEKVLIKLLNTEKYFDFGAGTTPDLVLSETSALKTFTLDLKGTTADFGVKGENGRYLSTERRDGPATINARVRGGIIGAWETITIEHLEDDVYAFRGNNGRYLSAAGGDNQMRFNSVSISDTERFVINNIEDTLSTDDLFLENKLFIAPNPVLNDLNIINLDESTYEAIVYNLMGQKVMMSNITGNTNTLDVSQLSSGNYILVLKNKTSNKVLKFIKN